MTNHPNRNVTPMQRLMLEHYLEDGEPGDFGEFGGPGSLAWMNRERVITALQRKGFIDKDQIITDAGRAALTQSN